ncbi:hypothetical protein CHS0354_030466 [Potamilus streckersoni]|uniref:Uncharacterized protein n=1 Tax=Potamilus streckersoni TaxID=2493646 RepID=A0AAE0RPD1_9BIVA|nr:hypothetical protein CHS0354_030466 [Potamilus streckersoni]
MAKKSVEFSVLIMIVTVTLMTSATIGCSDRHVWIADGSYSCKGLLDPADTVGLYPKRVYFCNTYKLTYCCQTCKLVNEELKKLELQKKEFQKQELQRKEIQVQNLQKNEVQKEALKTKETKKPLVDENQIPDVIVSSNSYLTVRPEKVFQEWISTLYQYFYQLSKSNNLQNRV